MSVNPKKTKKTNRSDDTEVISIPAPRSDASSSSPFTPSADDSAQLHLDQARIARARQLLDQDGYPSEKILQSIAKHLARNWSDEGAPVILSPPRS